MKFDYTTYSTYERCEVEGVYRMQRHLVSAGVEAAPHFGQIVHLGVRALYDGKSVMDAQAAIKAAWAVGVEPLLVANALREDVQVCDLCGGVGASGAMSLQAAIRTIGRQTACACKTPITSILLGPKKPHLSLWRAREIVNQYHMAYSNGPQSGDYGPWECVWNEGYAENATECALPDRCVRAKSDGLLYAMDLKTTSMHISQSWQRSFEHNQQVAIQLDALEATLGERINGFWLDGVHISRSRAPTSDDFVRYGPIAYSEALRTELRQQRARSARCWRNSVRNASLYAIGP